jgi:hypothetical protein
MSSTVTVQVRGFAVATASGMARKTNQVICDDGFIVAFSSFCWLQVAITLDEILFSVCLISTARSRDCRDRHEANKCFFFY